MSPIMPDAIVAALLIKTWALPNLALTLANSDLTLDSFVTSVGSAMMGIYLLIMIMFSTVRLSVWVVRPTRTIPAAPA